MKYNYILVALVAQFFAATVAADTGYKYLGYGRLVTNDLLGDGKDRWRTGSVSTFRMYVQDEVDLKYLKLGEAVELRTHFEVDAPSDLQAEDGGGSPMGWCHFFWRTQPVSLWTAAHVLGRGCAFYR